MRYSPGSLVVVACADAQLRARFVARVIDEQSSVLSLDKVRTLLAGKVPEADLDAKANALLDAAVAEALRRRPDRPDPAADADGRGARAVRALAAAHRRPRHLVLVEAGKDKVSEDDREPLGDLRTALNAGELGQEGFMTSLRLGGNTIDELKKIIFAPPPADD